MQRKYLYEHSLAKEEGTKGGKNGNKTDAVLGPKPAEDLKQSDLLPDAHHECGIATGYRKLYHTFPGVPWKMYIGSLCVGVGAGSPLDERRFASDWLDRP